MPINLDAPLAWERANADELAMLDDLQGNILKGHGRNHTQNLFFVLDPQKPQEGRGFLKVLAQSIKSARQQLQEAKEYRISKKDAGVFITVVLSASGYGALGIAEDSIPADPAFRSGLKQRKDILSDPDPEEWDPAFQEPIHGMILIGGSDEAQVRQVHRRIQQQKPASVKIIGTEYGLAMRNKNGDGIEHFGYVDGRSQPLLLQEDIEIEKTQKDGIDIWDPTFPLKQVLVPCPGGASKDLSFGSYFVFRKLEQNVKGFKEREEAIAEELKLAETGQDPELAGAMLVGRFEDGTPVVLKNTDGLVNPVKNNFDFSQDTAGGKCPFHGHIRKTNPRGDSVREFGVPLEEERSHIMARRGITYGTRNAELDAEGKIIELKDKPVGGVGLLFMAYQSNFENQFEFTQASWANNPGFVKGDAGLDPVIGQGAGSSTPQQQPAVWGDANSKKPIDFHGFVTMKGGEYFFSPCISFFKNL
ncbi:Dyp-type peroxidase [Altericista sp. CCNU0014]|uniref:Dyp-type peroxidase n=1 Tax=Altericista sp. CCNU0014 TaxID=3082949 RepID=UPI00384CBC9B